MVMDDVDATCAEQALDRSPDQESVDDLGIGVSETLRDGALPQRHEFGGRPWVTSAQQSDAMPAGDKGVGELGDDGLDASVRFRWHIEVGRGGQHDVERMCFGAADRLVVDEPRKRIFRTCVRIHGRDAHMALLNG
jgi:hypothetical protein